MRIELMLYLVHNLLKTGHYQIILNFKTVTVIATYNGNENKQNTNKCISEAEPTRCTFLYSLYYELTASTCFEDCLLIFRSRCTNNWYTACVLCLFAATRVGVFKTLFNNKSTRILLTF
jgi:hypothetical protein